MRKKLAFLWHSFRHSYHNIIIQDCLCDKTKEQINKEIDYHLAKIREFQASDKRIV